jgi:hypothetical protein
MALNDLNRIEIDEECIICIVLAEFKEKFECVRENSLFSS